MSKDYSVETLPVSKWAEWNTFVTETPQGTIFHRSEWLSALTKNLSILVCRGKSGQIVGGIPLVERKNGWYRVFSPPALAPYAGLVLSEPRSNKLVARYAEQKEKAVTLLEAIPQLARVSFPLHISNTDAQPLQWLGYSVTLAHTYCIDASRSVEEVWENLETRSPIRKAEKAGIVVKTTDDIGELLPLLAMTFDRQGKSLPNDESYYRRLWKAACELGSGRIYMAYGPDGAPHAGLMIVWDPRSSYYLLGGGDPDKRNSCAGVLAVWEAIKDSLNEGRTFNFEGSTLPGVELYFRGWGGTLYPIIQAEKVTSLFLGMLLAANRARMRRRLTREFCERRK